MIGLKRKKLDKKMLKNIEMIKEDSRIKKQERIDQIKNKEEK